MEAQTDSRNEESSKFSAGRAREVEYALNTQDFAADLPRARSSQRLKYEIEVDLIRKKIGGLEAIRETLGLSQRKICQLLLVDPSSWSRWLREGDDAPPHIYRSLQWYLALQEKYPALDTAFWLQTVARVEAPADRILDLETKLEALKRKLRESELRQRRLLAYSGAAIIILSVVTFLILR